jgi:hypothetical protein
LFGADVEANGLATVEDACSKSADEATCSDDAADEELVETSPG